jgi:stage 0 sporulation regulatory protein
MSINSLLKDIEKCRSEMVQLASSSSMSNQKVIEASTKLDKLLNVYYRLSSKRNYT